MSWVLLLFWGFFLHSLSSSFPNWSSFMLSYLISEANVVMIQNDKSMVIVSRNAKDGDENFVGCFITSFVKWQVIEMRHFEFFSARLSFNPHVTLTKHRRAVESSQTRSVLQPPSSHLCLSCIKGKSYSSWGTGWGCLFVKYLSASWSPGGWRLLFDNSTLLLNTEGGCAPDLEIIFRFSFFSIFISCFSFFFF